MTTSVKTNLCSSLKEENASFKSMTKTRCETKVKKLEHSHRVITLEKSLSFTTQREALRSPAPTTPLLERLVRIRLKTCSNSSHSLRKNSSTEQSDTMMISRFSWKVHSKLLITYKMYRMKQLTKSFSAWPSLNLIKVLRSSQLMKHLEWCKSFKTEWSKFTPLWTTVLNSSSKDCIEAPSLTIDHSSRKTRLM